LWGAQVTIAGRPNQLTNAQGWFTFEQVPAGEYTLTISKRGYATTTKSVSVIDASDTSVVVAMTPAPEDLNVVEIRGKYCNTGKPAYYLDGVGLTETFTATIDWRDYTPGTVRWITPKQIYDDSTTGSNVARSFDMGNDFGSGGTLKVVAIAAGGAVQSLESRANFLVIPPPPLTDWISGVVYQPVSGGEELQYRPLGVESAVSSIADWDSPRSPARCRSLVASRWCLT